MPIFHDHDSPDQKEQDTGEASPVEVTRSIFAGQQVRARSRERRGSETSTIAICDVQATADFVDSRANPLTRGQLIERIKRTNSPIWTQHTPVSRQSPLSSNVAAQPQLARPQRDRPRTPGRRSPDRPCTPPAQTQVGPTPVPSEDLPVQADNREAGLQIERPRSALHSGDFRPQAEQRRAEDASSKAFLATSPVAPWHHEFPRSAFSRFSSSSLGLKNAPPATSRGVSRSRALSQVSLSNVILMPTTSPLVNQSSNADLDDPVSRPASRSPDRQTRRHTFSPRSFHAFENGMLPKEEGSGLHAPRHTATLRREGTYPYQAHQPRRSLHSFSTSFSSCDPQSPWLRSRRPSISGESSPLQHAPMVGSYEESILRGRMSTTPSRPLNFMAQIGVLGKGTCKGSLKCPRHVAVPFPAVFYSYAQGSGRTSSDSPSPYVGLIDLEHSLAAPEESHTERRRRKHTSRDAEVNSQSSSMSRNQYVDGPASEASARRREKQKRRAQSPKAPPGGCYRIPQQGQLQIVIKNPNKTAVKLFLVPYDLSDMEPGHKTFIRQRSYSAGPIIDMPLASRRNFGTDRPEAALSHSDDPNDRPVLRYLIHLHICCTSKGRYYLYKSIRVVFANRVPDGKEKLRNEIQLPEPRYSTYKASRDSHVGAGSPCTPLSGLALDRSLRRRSAGMPWLGNTYDDVNGVGTDLPTDAYPNTVPFGNSPPSSLSSPLVFRRLDILYSRPTSRQETERMDLDPESPTSRSFSRRIVKSHAQKLPSECDSGAPAFGAGSPCGEGLLAMKLRGLDVQRSP